MEFDARNYGSVPVLGKNSLVPCSRLRDRVTPFGNRTRWDLKGTNDPKERSLERVLLERKRPFAQRFAVERNGTIARMTSLFEVAGNILLQDTLWSQSNH